MNVNKILSLLVMVGSLAGCATVLEDSMQPVKVEVVTPDGESIVGAKCDLTNSVGTFSSETPKTVMIRKASSELVIFCKTTDELTAEGKAISRIGGTIFGNILLGGPIGMIVDASSDSSYNYPEWVKLVVGKSLTYDRRNHQKGLPTPSDAEVLEKEGENTPKK